MAGEIGEDDPDAPKCPVCKEPAHARPLVYPGNNKRGKITDNLKASNALNIPDIKEHIFYRRASDPENRSVDRPRISPEGHHLITVEAVEEDVWKDLFDAFGYDINCPQNGVMLPGDMWVACHFGIPRHKGNHWATFGEDLAIGKTYVDAVRNKLSEIDEPTQELCKENKVKQFHDLMLEKSHEIFEKIMSFAWTISSDGYDYPKTGVTSSLKGDLGIGSGCYKRCTSLTTKVAIKILDKGVTIPSDTSKQEMHMIARDAVSEGMCNRDHSKDGCVSQSEIQESKYRYNIPDPNIT